MQMVQSCFFSLFIYLFLIIIFDKHNLLITAYETNLENGKCSANCSGISHIHYDNERKYFYRVTNEANIVYEGANHQIRFKENFVAEITVLSPCDFILKLSGIRSDGVDDSLQWSKALLKHNLLFGFDNGEVVSVCPHEDEPLWVVNFKRAFLSSFQTLESPTETDILGYCAVKRETKLVGTSLLIHSFKSDPNCERGDKFDGVRSSSYQKWGNEKPDWNHHEQKCSRTVANKQLQKVECVETHEIPNFDGKAFGKATIKLKSDLIEVSTNDDLYPTIYDSAPFRRSLVHENTAELPVNNGDSTYSNSLIDTLCKINNNLEIEKASIFSDLTSHLRSLSRADIQSVAKQDCEIFIDAVAACATPNCISYLVELISAMQSPRAIFSSLTFVQNPPIESVNHLSTIIEKVSNADLLPISSLLHSYCLKNTQCLSEPSVKTIIDSIIRKFSERCDSTLPEETDKLIIVLKAIGNIGIESQSLMAINDCIKSAQIVDVKITAIDALRRKKCSDTRDSIVAQLFFDKQGDAEVRIAAFNQLMACPHKFISRIVEELDHTELSNQVGSYVWSYLTARSRSTNPSNSDLSDLFKRHSTSSKFDKDSLRFSKFDEYGAMLKNYFGAHVESTTIFSPESYIPRQISANASIHIFGNSINFFEIGVRACGTESIESAIFGPNGFYTNQVGFLTNPERRAPHSPKIEQLQREYSKKRRSDKAHVAGGIYVRMFGDDLFYEPFHLNSNEMRDYLKEFNLFTKPFKGMSKLHKNSALEVGHVIPTLTGFPLRASVKASVVAKFENLMQIQPNEPPRFIGNFKTSVMLNPTASVSLEIKSAFHVGDRIINGLRVTKEMQTGVNMRADLAVEKFSLIKAKIILPEKTLVILQSRDGSAKIDKSQYIRVQHERSQKSETCSSPQFSNIVGVKFCKQLDLTSDIQKIVIEKEDLGIRTIEMIAGKQVENDAVTGVIGFDTPGSNVNRKFEAKLTYEKRKKFLLSLISPSKTIKVVGNIIKEERDANSDQNAIDLKLTVDKQVYNMKANLKIEEDIKGKSRYDLHALGTDHASSSPELVATFEKEMKKFGFDLTLKNVNSKPIILKGVMQINDPIVMNFVLDGIYPSGFIKASVDKSTANQYLIAIDSQYHASETDKYSLVLNGSSIKQVEKRSLAVSLKASSNNRDLNLQFVLKKLSNMQYIFSHKSKYESNGEVKSDNSIEIKYQNQFPQKFQLGVKMDCLQLKNLAASIEHEAKIDPKLMVLEVATLSYPGIALVIKNEMKELEIRVFSSALSIEFNKRKILSTLCLVVAQPKNYSIDAIIESTNFDDRIRIVAQGQGDVVPYAVAKLFKISDHANDGKIFLQVRNDLATVLEFNYQKSQKANFIQQINCKLKSDHSASKMNYNMILNLHQKESDLSVDAVIDENTKQLMKVDFTIPRSLQSAVVTCRAQMSFEYENREHLGLIEYRKNVSDHGLIMEADDLKINAKLETLCPMHFLSTVAVAKSGRTILSTVFDVYSIHMDELDLGLKIATSEPLPTQSTQAKLIAKFKADEVFFDAHSETNGQRYLLKGDWKSLPQNVAVQNHYIYSLQMKTPMIGLDVDQQFAIDRVPMTGKIHTSLTAVYNTYLYSVKNKLESSVKSVSCETELKYNKFTTVQHFNYIREGNEKSIKVLVKVNDFEMRKETTFLSTENAFSIKCRINSNHNLLRKYESEVSCNRESSYWSCGLRSNLNDLYIGNIFQSLAPSKADLNYNLALHEIYDGNFQLKYDFVQPNLGYNAILSIKHRELFAKFILNVVRGRGSASLETPEDVTTYEDIEEIRATKDELEVLAKSGRSGKSVKIEYTNKESKSQFGIQLLGIKREFEISFNNELSGSGEMQTIALQIILSPRSLEKIYGMTTTIDNSGNVFRGLKTRLSNPKRDIDFELQFPTNRRLIIIYQLDSRSLRKPTEIEFNIRKDPTHFALDISLFDDVLKKPIKFLFDVTIKRTDHKFQLDLKGEIDYLGKANEVILASIHFDSSSANSHPIANSMFKAEFKLLNPNSDVNFTIAAALDRKEIEGVLVPVQTKVYLVSEHKRRSSVEFSVGAISDARSYIEIGALLGDSKARLRIERSANALHAIFYENDDKATAVSDISATTDGIRINVRDVNSDEVLLNLLAILVDDYSGLIELWHSKERNKIIDIKMKFEVDGADKLSSEFFVRPDLNAEINKTIGTMISKMKQINLYTIVEETINVGIESQKSFARYAVEISRSWLNEQENILKEMGADLSKIDDVLALKEAFRFFAEALNVTTTKIQMALKENHPTEGIVSSIEEYALSVLKSWNKLKVLEHLKMLETLLNNFLQRSICRFQENIMRVVTVMKVDEWKGFKKLQDISRTGMGVSDSFRELQKHIGSYSYLLRKSAEFVIQNIVNRFAEMYLGGLTADSIAPLLDISFHLNKTYNFSFVSSQTSNDGLYRTELVIPYAKSVVKFISGFNPLYIHGKHLRMAKQDTEKYDISGSIYTFRSMPQRTFDPFQPFERRGYVMNRRWFITFDGLTFTLDTPCDYILANDLLNNNILIVASLGPYGMNLIRIEFYGKKVSMYDDGKVMVDDNFVTLPWQMIHQMDGSTLILLKRDGNWIYMQTYDGHFIRCNLNYYIWEIIVPPRMHAKLGGLLGFNDNEPSNDFNYVDGAIISDLNLAAKHWSYSAHCENHYGKFHTARNFHEKSSSSEFGWNFHRCHDQVHPLPFGNQRLSAEDNLGSCPSLAGYVAICRGIGVDLPIPDFCVTCLNGLTKREEKIVRGRKAIHDIIFVIEERRCNDENRQYVKRLIPHVERFWQNTKFGWIGFGGEALLNYPYILYTEKDALHSSDQIMKKLSYQFEPTSGLESEGSNAIDAIWLATKKFPFRENSAKTIILISCEHCEKKSIGGIDELAQNLLFQGTKFHMLSFTRKREDLLHDNVVNYSATWFWKSNNECEVLVNTTAGSNVKVNVQQFDIRKTAANFAPSEDEGDSCSSCECTEDSLSLYLQCTRCES